VRRELKRRRQGRTYKVPQVEFWECCDCGERAYDREAIRKIQAHSRAFAPTLAGK
jgi:YgiT-type zinc finger domain-containing protein